MAIKTQEDFVRVEVVVAENSAQTVVEDTLSLPSHKKHCDRILKSDATARITNQKIEEDKVAVEGVLDVRLLYVSEEELEDGYAYHCESVHWDNAIPFVYFIDVPGAEAEMNPQTRATVEDLEVTVRSEGLSFEVDAVVGLETKVTEQRDIELLTECTALAPEKVTMEKDVLRVEDFIGRNSTDLELEDEINLLPGKPDVDEVLDYKVIPETVEVEAEFDKAVIRGYLTYKVLYRCVAGSDPAVAYAEWENATPFEAVLDVPGARPGMQIKPNLQVARARVESGYGARKLSTAADVAVEVKVAEPRQVPAVVSLSSETETEIASRHEVVTVENIIGKGHKQVSVDEVVDLPEPHPPIGQILEFSPRVTVTEQRVGTNRVSVEGYVDIDCAYLAHAEEVQPLNFAPLAEAVPFSVNLDVSGAETGMNCDVDVKVEACDPDLINRETIEVQAVLTVTARVTEMVEREVVVEAVAVPPIKSRPATITCLIVQPGDTLWKLSRRYRTTEDAILAANPWLQEELEQLEGPELEVGWRILIPRVKAAAG